MYIIQAVIQVSEDQLQDAHFGPTDSFSRAEDLLLNLSCRENVLSAIITEASKKKQTHFASDKAFWMQATGAKEKPTPDDNQESKDQHGFYT